MAAGTVRLIGYRETLKALDDVDRKAAKLKMTHVADPVVRDAKRLIGRYRGAKVNLIKPKATARAVVVQQGARKKTGKRPDYGFLQQRRLEEALEQNEREVIRNVAKAVVELIADAGF